MINKKINKIQHAKKMIGQILIFITIFCSCTGDSKEKSEIVNQSDNKKEAVMTETPNTSSIEAISTNEDKNKTISVLKGSASIIIPTSFEIFSPLLVFQ